MDHLEGNLWQHNFAKLVVLDVSDDYELMQPPLPHVCYPVLAEMWLPRYKLVDRLPETPLVEGYLYDWHESADDEKEEWFVGVVRQEMVQRFLSEPRAC